MPEPLSVITMHENASARAISLLVYMLDERQTLRLYTLFDWDEVGKCCLVDTHMFLVGLLPLLKYRLAHSGFTDG